MPSLNPGPASTVTPSTEAVLAPQSFPNFNAQGQGSNAYRLLAFQKAVPINGTGDAAFLPFLNIQAFSFQPVATSIILANPGAFVSGVFTPGTSVACVFRLWSGPAGTGQAVCASTTSTMTGATAALSQQLVAATATGYFLVSNWGVGQTNGQGGAASNGIYFNVTTASASTATQWDMYIYGMDLT
jgi:hypothetical protein